MVEHSRQPHQEPVVEGSLEAEAGLEREHVLAEHLLRRSHRRFARRTLLSLQPRLEVAQQQHVERRQWHQQEGAVEQQQTLRVGAHRAPHEVAERGPGERQQRRQCRRGEHQDQHAEGQRADRLEALPDAQHGQEEHRRAAPLPLRHRPCLPLGSGDARLRPLA